jgi:hypothetical protein
LLQEIRMKDTTRSKRAWNKWQWLTCTTISRTGRILFILEIFFSGTRITGFSNSWIICHKKILVIIGNQYELSHLKIQYSETIQSIPVALYSWLFVSWDWWQSMGRCNLCQLHAFHYLKFIVHSLPILVSCKNHACQCILITDVALE